MFNTGQGGGGGGLGGNGGTHGARGGRRANGNNTGYYGPPGPSGANTTALGPNRTERSAQSTTTHQTGANYAATLTGTGTASAQHTVHNTPLPQSGQHPIIFSQNGVDVDGTPDLSSPAPVLGRRVMHPIEIGDLTPTTGAENMPVIVNRPALVAIQARTLQAQQALGNDGSQIPPLNAQGMPASHLATAQYGTIDAPTHAATSNQGPMVNSALNNHTDMSLFPKQDPTNNEFVGLTPARFFNRPGASPMTPLPRLLPDARSVSARFLQRALGRHGPEGARIGDVLSAQMIKQCLQNANLGPKWEFTDKAVYYVPNADDGVTQAGMYWELRYVTVVTINSGDRYSTLTGLPEFTYGGRGAYEDKEETMMKSALFEAEHMAILNRSQINE
jgi:hypothetical protein